MTGRAELFYSTYRHFTDPVSEAVRKETFGADIGQNSWLTVDEYERLLPWLDLSESDHVLEVASGSGGPALYVAHTSGCRVTGVDANESAVAVASQAAAAARASERVRFQVADANSELPFADESFEALLCIDAMNHFPQRLDVFREWRRVLRPGRRALFTDPVVITGPVTSDELARRSSIGLFLFVPPGVNERLIEQAGLRLVRQEDVTENAALVAGRWRRAGQAHEKDMRRIEGGERFEGLQVFFEAVHCLTGEKRLSRMAYVVEKPAV